VIATAQARKPKALAPSSVTAAAAAARRKEEEKSARDKSKERQRPEQEGKAQDSADKLYSNTARTSNSKLVFI
jgi:hypothetical protein